jgi:16S rRNA (adenine1518-N6/adenine1519-N6)-dimethyltransferase
VNRLHRPRKRYGQHFLEAAWVTRLIDLLAPQADDTFLEIGPGRGAVTARLAPRVRRLVCVEIDRDLAAHLRETMPSNVEVITGDFLDADVAALLESTSPAAGTPEPGRRLTRPPEPWRRRIVGNLPYNVSSPILFRLLRAADGPPPIVDATLMLQKEVAERLIAGPGTSEYGVLAIQTALVADVELRLILPPGAFRPPPRVTSAIVQLRFRPPAVDVGDRAVFEKVVRGVFLQRRKMIANALEPVAATFGRSPAELLAETSIDPRKRPEALTLDDFARLSRRLQKADS